MTAIEEDSEGFDLVISDWGRMWEGPGAGMRLLSKIRTAGSTLPLVFYHNEVEPDARAARAAAGTAPPERLGEAVYPAELIPLVLKGLGTT